MAHRQQRRNDKAKYDEVRVNGPDAAEDQPADISQKIRSHKLDGTGQVHRGCQSSSKKRLSAKALGRCIARFQVLIGVDNLVLPFRVSLRIGQSAERIAKNHSFINASSMRYAN